MRHASEGTYEYKRLNADIQRQARKDKEKYLTDICNEVTYASQGKSSNKFFNEVKRFEQSFSPRVDVIYAEDGSTITDEEEIRQRWKEYTENHYKRQGNSILSMPDEYDMEPEITFSEIILAIK